MRPAVPESASEHSAGKPVGQPSWNPGAQCSVCSLRKQESRARAAVLCNHTGLSRLLPPRPFNTCGRHQVPLWATCGIATIGAQARQPS